MPAASFSRSSARKAGSRYTATLVARSGAAEMAPNSRMLSKGNGWAMVNSKLRGRQLTWGCTGRPSSSSLTDSSSIQADTPGPPTPASSAVQEMGRPHRRVISANSPKARPEPIVAWMTPRPASPRAPVRARISSRSAARLGTGRPSKPTWVGDLEVAKPTAPASMASATMARMRAISSSVAARSVDSAPMTSRRTGVWPIMAATLMAGPRASTASRYCGKVSKGHSSPSPAASAAALMPSTFSSVRMIRSRWSGRVGATPKPQLPMTTVVTPCHGDTVIIRSHSTWAS